MGLEVAYHILDRISIRLLNEIGCGKGHRDHSVVDVSKVKFSAFKSCSPFRAGNYFADKVKHINIWT